MFSEIALGFASSCGGGRSFGQGRERVMAVVVECGRVDKRRRRGRCGELRRCQRGRLGRVEEVDDVQYRGGETDSCGGSLPSIRPKYGKRIVSAKQSLPRCASCEVRYSP